jgi:uncharacterized protein with NRDE domain
MCLIFFAIKQHPDYKLIIAANRDEFYNRKTAPAGFWKDHPHLLGGRDLEAMGTWLGMTTRGKISMLTNYRDPKNINPSAPSRGKLVSDFLVEELNPENYLQKVAASGSLYNGFNLITGNESALWYYSNYGSGIQKLTKGFFGLSNHLLDTPWPKVEKGKANFIRLVKDPDLDPVQFFKLLFDAEQAPDHLLPDTGLTIDREKALSSIFIKSPNYGSRSSTVILIDNNNQVTFAERVYDTETFAHSTQTFNFKIGSE